MSHTPLDGPDRGTRESSDSTEEADTTGGFRAYVRRAFDAVRRAGESVRRFVESTGGSPPELEDDGGHATTPSVTPLEQSIPLGDGEAASTEPVVSDRTDDRPVPGDRTASPVDHPDLVARWHDDRLTLSEPDQPGAQISSDVWWEVDP